MRVSTLRTMRLEGEDLLIWRSSMSYPLVLKGFTGEVVIRVGVTCSSWPSKFCPRFLSCPFFKVNGRGYRVCRHWRREGEAEAKAGKGKGKGRGKGPYACCRPRSRRSRRGKLKLKRGVVVGEAEEG